MLFSAEYYFSIFFTAYWDVKSACTDLRSIDDTNLEHAG